MLWILFSFLLVSLALIGWGSLFSKELSLPEKGMIGFFVACFFGLALNFFLPLSSHVSALFVGGGLAIFAFRDSRTGKWISGILLGLACCVLTVRGFLHGDTGLYHLPSMVWLHESPIALGLANLNSRIGFNSSWFVTLSMFWLPGLGLSSVFIGNAVLVFFFLWVLFLEAENTSGKNRVLWAFCLLLFFLFAGTEVGKTLIRSSLGSPTTDFPSTVFGLYAVLIALRKRESEWLLILIASLLSATIKLSQIPILLLPLLTRTKKHTFIGIVFFSLWILRGVLLSGCIAYPEGKSCISALPWSVSTEITRQELEWIKSFARDPTRTPEVVLKDASWIPGWWNGFSSSVLMRTVLGMLFIALSFVVFQCIRRRTLAPLHHFQVHRKLLIVLTTGSIFWFIQAPDLRFGFLFLVGLGVLLAAISAELLPEWSPRTHLIWTGFTSALLILFFVRSLYTAKGIKYQEFIERWPSIPEIESETFVAKNGLSVLKPLKGECWNLPKLCAPYPPPDLEMDSFGIWTLFTNRPR